jgi:HEAT repeat protein
MCTVVGILLTSICMTQPQGDKPAPPSKPGTAAERQLKLTVRVSLTDPKPENTTLVALSEATVSPLTAADAATADRALKQLFAACAQDDEVPAILIGAVPDRALQHFLTVFSGASEAAQRAMAIEAARLDEPDARKLVAMALMTSSAGSAAKTVLDRGKELPIDAVIGAFATATDKQVLEGLFYVGAAGDESRVEALRVLAAHKSPAVRAKALVRMAVIGTDGVLGDFRRALGDAAPDVRKQALEGLTARGKLTNADLIAALQGADEATTILVLERIPATKDPTLVALVTKTAQAQDSKQWPAALTAAARMGIPDLIPSLVAMLSSDKKDVRATAAAAFGIHPGVTDFAPLLRLAKDDAEYAVYTAAGKALAAAGPKGVAAALAGLKPTDKGWNAFMGAVPDKGEAAAQDMLAVARVQVSGGSWLGLGKACAAIKPPARYELAALVLERGDGLAQAEAIKALVADASPGARAVLLKACGYPNVLPSKVVDTTWDFQRAGNQFIGTTRFVEGSIWQLLLDALGKLDQQDAATARQHLVPLSVSNLAHTTPIIRAGAIVAWAKLAPADHAPRIRAAVQRMASDPDEVVRAAAATTAAGLGGADLLPSVQALLNDDARSVRLAAMAALPKYPAQYTSFVAAIPKIAVDHESQEKVVEVLSQLPAPQATVALRTLVANEKDHNLAVKAIGALWTLAASGALTVAQLEEALAPALKGPKPVIEQVALCALASQGSPQGLQRLLELGSGRKDGLMQFSMAADYGSQAAQDLISASRVRVVARLGFQRGYKSTGFMNTTFLLNLPVAVGRQAARFGPGDRWPLNLTQSPPTHQISTPLMAAARYDDPRVTALIAAAAASTDVGQRKSAVWAMALRDDRAGLERMLGDAQEEVAREAIGALRLLGHRASVPALAAWVDKNTTAAKTVVEVTRFQDTVGK